MLAGLVEEKNSAAIAKPSDTTRINPAEVRLWLLKNGKIESLQHSDTSLLAQDFFNIEFQKNHEEMFQLLKLLPNENITGKPEGK